MGISQDLPDLMNRMNSTIFQSYILNSNIYGDFWSNFFQYIKVPKGYKFDCSIYDSPVNCTMEIKNNQTLIKEIGDYIWNTMMQPRSCIGYDMEKFNFSVKANSDSFI